MSDIDAAIAHLKANDIEAVDGGGILIVPYDYISEFPEEFTNIVSKVKHLLNEIGYDKSWQIDPHYNTKRRLEDGTIPVGPDE